MTLTRAGLVGERIQWVSVCERYVIRAVECGARRDFLCVSPNARPSRILIDVSEVGPAINVQREHAQCVLTAVRPRPHAFVLALAVTAYDAVRVSCRAILFDYLDERVMNGVDGRLATRTIGARQGRMNTVIDFRWQVAAIQGGMKPPNPPKDYLLQFQVTYGKRGLVTPRSFVRRDPEFVQVLWRVVFPMQWLCPIQLVEYDGGRDVVSVDVRTARVDRSPAQVAEAERRPFFQLVFCQQ